MASGLLANGKRNGTGTLRTHYLTGRGPNTSSTRCRALSAIWRPPQLRQNSRFLQENASSRYSGLPALRPSGQPTAVQIRSRRICPHGTARTPRAGSRARARRNAERLELLAHVLGQLVVLRSKTRHEVRVVRLHPRVQQRALGRMASIGRCGRQRGRCGDGEARRCATVKCGEAQHDTLLCIDGCTVFSAASSRLARPHRRPWAFVPFASRKLARRRWEIAYLLLLSETPHSGGEPG